MSVRDIIHCVSTFVNLRCCLLSRLWFSIILLVLCWQNSLISKHSRLFSVFVVNNLHFLLEEHHFSFSLSLYIFLSGIPFTHRVNFDLYVLPGDMSAHRHRSDLETSRDYGKFILWHLRSQDAAHVLSYQKKSKHTLLIWLKWMYSMCKLTSFLN